MYRIKRYTKPLAAIHDRRGVELFSSEFRDLVFDYIYRQRYLKHPSLMDRNCSEMGFPQPNLREEYDAYQAALERDESEPSSAPPSEQFAHL